MKKSILILTFSILIVALCAFLGSCKSECAHAYDNACDTACNLCDEIRTTSHDMTNASCTVSKTCDACGATEGAAAGHAWKDATCTDPKTCGACGETEGEALGHKWVDATCTAPKSCGVCGETEGDALPHTPDADDGDCTTAVHCSTCGGVLTNGTDGHVDADKSGLCDREGCNQTVDSSIEEETEPGSGGGFDFPMDENP